MFARRRFGQHFLERAWAGKLTRAINPRPDETFLEIGPGRGALTFPLAAAARHVIAIELDRDLAADLRAIAPPNVTVVEADFLHVGLERIQAEIARGERQPASIRAAGNLPYNVASPILFRLIDLHQGGLPVADAVVMLQREVAERLTAHPGTSDYGVLTVMVRRHADVETLLRLPPGAFRPAPKVESAVVQLRFHPPAPPVRDSNVFAALTQAIFTRRRKMLSNALLAYPPAQGRAAALLEQAGISGVRRPETLDIVELARLSDVLTELPEQA